MYQAQVVFQMRIRPGSYKIGQQTIYEDDRRIDEHIPNSRLEFYIPTAEKGCVQFTGLMLQLLPIAEDSEE